MSNTYISNGGEIACQGHMGMYAAFEAAQGKRRIVTPLAVWDLLDSEGLEIVRKDFEDAGIIEDGVLCEGCRYGSPLLKV